jgi:hypothetical protein
MATKTYTKLGDQHYMMVDDGDDSITICLEITDEDARSIYVTETDASGYSPITEANWMEVLEPSTGNTYYVLEFVGGHPPHFPIPTRPK